MRLLPVLATATALFALFAAAEFGRHRGLPAAATRRLTHTVGAGTAALFLRLRRRQVEAVRLYPGWWVAAISDCSGLLEVGGGLGFAAVGPCLRWLCDDAAVYNPVIQRESVMLTDLTRRGIYALPAAGVLTAAPWVFILSQPSIKADPGGYARGLTTTGTALAGYLYLAGLICLLFGVLALCGYLARTRASSWAGGGMIISVVAIGMALPVSGILGLAQAVLADAYLAGTKTSAQHWSCSAVEH